MDDHGPKPHAFDMRKAVLENSSYRRTVWTGHYLQVTLMSIPAGESTGLEVHPKNDQFIRVDGGTARLKMGSRRDALDVEHDVADGWTVIVPANTWHDIVNTGDDVLSLYTIHSPVHHSYGVMHETKDQADHAEKVGTDFPPRWTNQPY